MYNSGNATERGSDGGGPAERVVGGSAAAIEGAALRGAELVAVTHGCSRLTEAQVPTYIG